MECRVRLSSSEHSRTFQLFRTDVGANPFNNWFFEGWEKLISSTELYFPHFSLYRTKMAPRDQLSTKERNMELQSERKILIESKWKCRS